MMAGEGGYAMRLNALSLFILNINLEGLCQIQAKCSGRAAIFDSYNCRDVESFGQCRPWPTQRQGQSEPLAVPDVPALWCHKDTSRRQEIVDVCLYGIRELP